MTVGSVVQVKGCALRGLVVVFADWCDKAVARKPGILGQRSWASIKLIIRCTEHCA